MISLGVNTHSADVVSMYPAGSKAVKTPKSAESTKGADSSPDKTVKQAETKPSAAPDAVTDTFSMAAASEQLAGKQASEGVKSLSSDPNVDLGEFKKDEESQKKKEEEKPTVIEEKKSKNSKKVIVETKADTVAEKDK